MLFFLSYFIFFFFHSIIFSILLDLSNEHLFRAYNDQQSDDNDDNNISNRVGIGVGMANNMANINIGDDSNLSESFMGVKER